MSSRVVPSELQAACYFRLRFREIQVAFEKVRGQSRADVSALSQSESVGCSERRRRGWTVQRGAAELGCARKSGVTATGNSLCLWRVVVALGSSPRRLRTGKDRAQLVGTGGPLSSGDMSLHSGDTGSCEGASEPHGNAKLPRACAAAQRRGREGSRGWGPGSAWHPRSRGSLGSSAVGTPVPSCSPQTSFRSLGVCSPPARSPMRC